MKIGSDFGASGGMSRRPHLERRAQTEVHLAREVNYSRRLLATISANELQLNLRNLIGVRRALLEANRMGGQGAGRSRDSSHQSVEHGD